MKWVIGLSNRAERNLKHVPAADRTRLLSAIDAMSTDSFAGDVVKLKGQAAFRRRVGNYRIIFSINFTGLSVGIADIQRRTTTTYR
jgi:mRNA interferase RelE/StbE